MLAELIHVQYCYSLLVEQIPMGLLLYSHLPVAIAAGAFSAYVWFKAKSKASFLLFLTCFTFIVWCALDLNAWFAFMGSANTMFVWSMFDFLAVLMFFLAYYFLNTFVTGDDLPLWQKIFSLLLILPIAYISYAGLNISLYELNYCQAIEDKTFTVFTYYVEGIFILLTAVFIVLQYRRVKEKEERTRTLLAGAGVLTFLLFFFSASFLVFLLASTDAAPYVYNYLIYGLFGMPIFLIYLGYLIVRYKAFDLRILSVQALVASLVIIIGSMSAYASTTTNRILVLVSLVLVLIAGRYLIRATRKEIETREKGEQLARYLANANARLRELDRQKTEFVSIASHQLRAPIAAITGYASLLADGSYGPVPDTVREPLMRVLESGKRIAIMVDDFLNVTRMEQGRMTYAHLPVDMCKLVRGAVSEVALIAQNRGLTLDVHTPEGEVQVMGDEGKLKQILSNIIDNAIKYTKVGFVRVTLEVTETQRSVIISVADSGIGIAPEELPRLFTKFNRASNANNATVSGTGLGLYIAKEIVKAHNGWLHVSSPGVDKGSIFTIELPLASLPTASGVLTKGPVLASK